mmetsp:Transcript_2882/g.6360  ORF Transcript_2882/g.6360 Transcript_2882/m.6360 type:complete len:643 (-) Transcript_2882:22-1950(-)
MQATSTVAHASMQFPLHAALAAPLASNAHRDIFALQGKTSLKVVAAAAGALCLMQSMESKRQRCHACQRSRGQRWVTQMRASARRTTSSAPGTAPPVGRGGHSERNGIKNPDGWQWVSGRWVTKEQSAQQKEKIELALQNGRLRHSGLVLELERYIQQAIPSFAGGEALGDTCDDVAQEWSETYIARFGEKLLSVLATASESARAEFGVKEALLGLLSCPVGGPVFRAATNDEVVDAVHVELKEEVGSGEKAETISSFTPALRGIIEAVEQERQRFGHEEAEPGHLILVLTSGADCSHDALQKFERAGLDLRLLRKHALGSLDGFLAQAESRSEGTLSKLFQEEVQEPLKPPIKLEAACASLSKDLMERDVEAKLLMLAALSGEHLFLLGAPGTAKSLLARRLSTLCAGNFFERLLTRFSVPEELFGPLSLQALERDELKRKTEGFLPQADVAFVDEIFKANSSILNTLLMILNERYFDNGREREHVPLWCVVAASNELPDTDELDALYDRFLLRRCVQRVSTEAVIDFLSLALEVPKAVKDGDDATLPKLTKRRAEELQCLAEQVTFPKRLLKVMAELREYCSEELSLNVSDRRLLKAAQLLRVAAASVGAPEVVEADLWILQHVFWDKNPQHSAAIKEWL